MSNIDWTDKTWNPIVGCEVLSKGCTNCYAMKMANRLAKMPATRELYGPTVKVVNGNAVWTGKLAFSDKALTKPLHWKKPRRIFVNSMSDMFHDSVPDEWLDQIFAVMALTPHHTYQILTKRPQRMREYVTALYEDGDRINDIACRLMDWDEMPEVSFPLPNVWLGVSAEDQTSADERIPLLLKTPAAKRFISAEPLLGPVVLTDLEYSVHGVCVRLDSITGKTFWWDHDEDSGDERRIFIKPKLEHLDWVIVGGESGPKARPMHPDWARSLREQCKASNTPFFFKQWGSWCGWDDAPEDLPDITDLCDQGKFKQWGLTDLETGKQYNKIPDMRPANVWVPKKYQPNPATLDGIPYQQYPTPEPSE